MFVDEARITVEAGDGGDGIISFQRQHGQRRGGPDGGCGGAGGDVYLQAVESISTLLHFNKQQVFKGEQGGKGGTQDRRGASGDDEYVNVPVGTRVYDLNTESQVADLDQPGKKALVAKGGRGGRGNAHFTSSTRRAPRIREWGEAGQKRRLKLELQILADVGIIGFPNVGKSSLISRISSQTPEIGNYHFTTMDPHPGVVEVSDWENFVAVDIPGIIEGAHKGKGLGNDFLRHLLRTNILLHLVDISGIEGRDPLEDWRVLRHEVRSFHPSLGKKPEFVAGNKADLVSEAELERQKNRFEGEGLELIPISAATGAGVSALVSKVYQALQDAQRERDRSSKTSDQTYKEYTFEGERGYEVYTLDDKLVVEGSEVERLANMLDLSTEDGIDYFYEQLERKGVISRLEQAGAEDGTVIVIGGREFEFAD
ncbi:MAG: GTPase ObgE [Candidatus Acetothermia bacterium]